MVVLGISPGTRACGIAVIQNRKLFKWQTLSFHQKWSGKKLKTIITTLASEIEKYDIQEIAIKIPDELPLSTGYIQLLGAINILCEQMSIKPRYYTLSVLKDRICRKKCPKEMLIKELLKIYPDLHCIQQCQYRKSIAYYNKTFEAVASAYCLQNEV